jgi:N,N'-diacetylbacillosaminyl-diphospho-undecaprenol alpha-1,3-N-acetylgalactosaminyltransferase
MIARVIRDKGVLEYIEAARRLERKATFLYIGEEDRGNPKALRPEWGPVRHLGFRSDVAEWIALSDLVVLPSYREGVPRTLLEAAAMGKALVATDVPGCREVVRPGENGRLVPARDAAALADAVEELLENPAMRMQMGRRSREIAVEEFDVRKVVEAYLEIYREVLQ